MALAGFIVLLLLGTEVLSAGWLILVFGVIFAIATYRAKGHVRSLYEIAQEIDRHLALKDQLSTAIYFGEHPDSNRAAPELVAWQREAAEAVARKADIRSALPFAMPKSTYGCTALAAIALSVFAIRYGVTRSLDLRPSLVQIAFNGILGTEVAAAAKKKTEPKTNGKRPDESALAVDPWQSKTLDEQGAPDGVLNTVDTPDVNNASYNTDANPKASGTKSKDTADQPGDPNGDSQQTPSGADQMADSSAAPDRDGARQSNNPGGQQDKQRSGGSGENTSLAEKMRDAISNLMSKLRMQPKPGESRSGQQGQQTAQSGQRQGQDDKGSPQQGKQQSDASSGQEQQGDPSGQSSDKTASAQNKSGSKSSDREQSQDGKSGIGKEDGDKRAREAEQLAAMGKISEIIGKRAANMSGEVMVEVGSGKQQLKTQYSQRKASHSDAGGEINRDEIPLAYQQLVQQYFEEIRKPATQTKGKKVPGS